MVTWGLALHVLITKMPIWETLNRQIESHYTIWFRYHMRFVAVYYFCTCFGIIAYLR